MGADLPEETERITILRQQKLEAVDNITHSLWPCVSELNGQLNLALELVASGMGGDREGGFGKACEALRDAMTSWMQRRSAYRTALLDCPLPVLKAAGQPRLEDHCMFTALRRFENRIYGEASLSDELRATLLKAVDDFHLTLAPAGLQRA